MCWDLMKLILTKPVSAIQKSRNPKGMMTTIEILLSAWALIGLSAFVATSSLPIQMRIGGALIVFALGTAATAFYAFLLQLVATNLGGKGRYYHALTALTFSKFSVAVGLLLASVLLSLGSFGVLLAVIAALVFIVNGISILFRTVKDYFGFDIITAWLTIGILVVGSVITLYVLAMGAITTSGWPYSPMMGYGMWGY